MSTPLLTFSDHCLLVQASPRLKFLGDISRMLQHQLLCVEHTAQPPNGSVLRVPVLS